MAYVETHHDSTANNAVIAVLLTVLVLFVGFLLFRYGLPGVADRPNTSNINVELPTIPGTGGNPTGGTDGTGGAGNTPDIGTGQGTGGAY